MAVEPLVVLVERLVTLPTFASREPSRFSTTEPALLAGRLSTLARNDPALFLERYGELCDSEELALHFAGNTDYEVQFHLARLRRTAAENSQRQRNRRFRMMQDLERAGDFFSDHNIQLRAPALYQSYVGRLLPNGGLSAAAEGGAYDDETPLSERLLANLDKDVRTQQVAVAAAALEQTEEQEDDEEDDDEDDEGVQEAVHARCGHALGCGEVVRHGSDTVVPSAARADDVEEADDELGGSSYAAAGLRVLEEEKRLRQHHAGSAMDRTGTDAPPAAAGDAALPRRLHASEQRLQRARETLMDVMRERFMRGDESPHFDYAARCDHNPALDDLEQESRDAEERWFDED